MLCVLEIFIGNGTKVKLTSVQFVDRAMILACFSDPNLAICQVEDPRICTTCPAKAKIGKFGDVVHQSWQSTNNSDVWYRYCRCR